MMETQSKPRAKAKTGLKPKQHFNSLPVDWEQIKLERVSGQTREDVALKHGVKLWTIRKREQREKWPLALDKARKAMGLSKTKSNEAAGLSSEANLAQIAQSHPLIMAEYMAKKRDEMLKKDLLQAPDSWKEAATMDSIMRKAAGLDRPQTQVQVNLWSGSGSTSPQVQTFDLD